MLLSQTIIERALAELLERARGNSLLRSELETSRDEFLSATATAGGTNTKAMAERRHLEWFLLERSSEALGAVPAQVLGVEPDSIEDSEFTQGREALLGSFASVFEITGVRSGEGVWVRDLAGLGEYPLEEADASRTLEVEDLLVGRVFPVGDALYRISHASGFFRDPRLLEAVRADLTRAREGRRAVLRLSQRELELMFFAGASLQPGGTETARANEKPTLDRATVIALARRCLSDGGLDDSEADDVLAELASEPFNPSVVIPGAGDRLGDILARLAFDTHVDLETARRALTAAWPFLCAAPEDPRPASAKPCAPRPEPKAKAKPPARKVERALSEFDARRLQGDGLDALFESLERELELDQDESEDNDSAPDFPGVVGAMVIEFLWDMDRERGSATARPLAAIANFSEFGRSYGVFENLGERDLLLFACLWLPERAPSAAEALRWLHSLVEFSRWSEERHGVALATALEHTRADLERSLARVCSANVALRTRWGDMVPGGEMLTYAGGGLARNPQGESRSVEIADAAAEFLEVGDFLRAQPAAASALRVVCVYPPQTARLAELT